MIKAPGAAASAYQTGSVEYRALAWPAPAEYRPGDHALSYNQDRSERTGMDPDPSYLHAVLRGTNCALRQLLDDHAPLRAVGRLADGAAIVALAFGRRLEHAQQQLLDGVLRSQDDAASVACSLVGCRVHDST